MLNIVFRSTHAHSNAFSWSFVLLCWLSRLMRLWVLMSSPQSFIWKNIQLRAPDQKHRQGQGQGLSQNKNTSSLHLDDCIFPVRIALPFYGSAPWLLNQLIKQFDWIIALRLQMASPVVRSWCSSNSQRKKRRINCGATRQPGNAQVSVFMHFSSSLKYMYREMHGHAYGWLTLQIRKTCFEDKSSKSKFALWKIGAQKNRGIFRGSDPRILKIFPRIWWPNSAAEIRGIGRFRGFSRPFANTGKTIVGEHVRWNADNAVGRAPK